MHLRAAPRSRISITLMEWEIASITHALKGVACENKSEVDQRLSRRFL
ncbi:hypothetical protein CCP3SC5AM1_60013 [Gammaproteobacteria bacterium]